MQRLNRHYELYVRIGLSPAVHEDESMLIRKAHGSHRSANRVRRELYIFLYLRWGCGPCRCRQVSQGLKTPATV